MTVAILAIGLFASGVATMVFVRNALITSQDEQLRERAASNASSDLIQFDDDGDVSIGEDTGQYFIAIYDAEGTLLGDTGGSSQVTPPYPESLPLDKVYPQLDTILILTDPATGTVFHASVGVVEVPGRPDLFSQMVALPLTPIDRTVATFFGIFSILALITMIAGALITRLLVTQTFRPLGQVESAAMTISAGDFTQRLTVGEPGTEVGKLTRAINTMLDRVDASLSDRDASVRQMRRFIGDASHELRTPLVTVRGYAELYRIGAIRGDEDIAQAMERIEKEAVRMGVLVEDLLALARLDERREVSITVLDLRPLARDAAMDVRAAAPQRPISVIDETAGPTDASPPAVVRTPTPGGEPDAESSNPVRRRAAPPTASTSLAGATLSLLRRIPRPVPASRATTAGETPPVTPVDLSTPRAGRAISLPPVVLGEENQVRQVVANLLGNARRFTPEDTPIEIRVGTDPERITGHAPIGMGWIAIADHGEGIPEQIRAHIFERFWRADTSRTRETGGTGLGLAIVASIVETLHGQVEVEDTPGGGATFRVFLPLAPESTLFLDTQPLYI